MPDGSLPLLISIVILVILSGFFSATETAFSCVNRIKLRTLHTNGNRMAGKVLNLAEKNYDRLLSTILVGNNIVNLSASTLSALLFAKLLTDSPLSPSVVSTAVITLAVLVFGEITPKFIAKTSPDRIAMLFYPVIRIFMYVFAPVNVIFSAWKKLIAGILKLKSNEIITEEEIMTIVEEAQEDGTLRQEETRLIRSVIEFDDLEVGDILVPRVNIVAVDTSEPMEEIRKVFVSTGFSRLPVYRDSIDSVIGTIHEKDFYGALIAEGKNLKDIIQEAFFTTKHTKISKLLKQMQKMKVHMAIVLDEYGGTLGLVTLEDILEELVGEIWDEHDEEISLFRKISDDTYIVSGDAPLSKLFDRLDLDGLEDDFDATTVSGWVMEQLGEIPSAGKTFTFRNLSIEITKSTPKKVQQVKIICGPGPDSEED